VTFWTPRTLAEPAPGQEDSTATELLKRCFDELAAQPKISVLISSRMVLESKANRSVVDIGYSLALRRPGCLAFRSSKATEGIDIVTDGRRAYSAAHRDQVYSIFDPPNELNELFRSPKPQEPWDFLNDWFLPAVCSREPAQRALAKISAVRELDATKIDGHPCRRLEIRSEQARCEIGILTEPQLRLRRFAWKMPPIESSDGPMQVSLETQLTEWEFQPQFEGETFSFQPAPGWKRVKDALAPSRSR
jgi:hypothetical protein